MQFTTTTTILAGLVALASAQPVGVQQAQLHGRQTVDLAKRDYTGKMTYYTPGQGSCGVTSTSSDAVVAVSSSVYGTYANPNSSPMCAKSITITANGKTVTAAIKDMCPSCGADDIDVSPTVFSQLGSLDVGKMTVTWTLN